MGRHHNVKLNIPMCLACVLFCLTLFSMHLTGGLYARYSATDSGEDSARVAVFKVETDLDYVSLGMSEGNVSLQLGGSGSISSVQIPFYIENSSEVAVAYSVTVDFGVNLPDYLTLTLSDGSQTKTVSADGSTSVFEFTEFGAMAAGAGTATKEDLTLTLAITDLSRVTAEVSIPTAELIVKVYQID